MTNKIPTVPFSKSDKAPAPAYYKDGMGEYVIKVTDDILNHYPVSKADYDRGSREVHFYKHKYGPCSMVAIVVGDKPSRYCAIMERDYAKVAKLFEAAGFKAHRPEVSAIEEISKMIKSST
jgi:hypothetical protein